MRHVAGGSGTRPPRRTAPNPPARARCGAAYAVDGYPSAGVSPSGAGLYNMIFLNSSKLTLPSPSLSANDIMSSMTWDSRASALGGRRVGRMRRGARARARTEGAADLVGRLRVREHANQSIFTLGNDEE